MTSSGNARVWITAGLLTLTACVAWGRPPCEPVGCTGIDVLPCGPFSIGNFTPNRDPVWVINLYGARYDKETPSGIRPEWRDSDFDGEVAEVNDPDPKWAEDEIPDAFNWLMREMDTGISRGYRRIVLFLPAGTLIEPPGPPDGERPMSASQWWTMPQWKRDAFESVIAEWIDNHPDANVSVYAGYQVYDPCDLETLSAADVVCDDGLPFGTDEIDACIVYNNVKPWLDIGIREYWFDASALHPEGLLSITHADEYDNVHMGGEAVPVTNPCNPANATIDFYLAERAPWMAARRYYFITGFANGLNAYGALATSPLNPTTTEIGMSYISDDDLSASLSASLSIVVSDRVKGFVPWVWYPKAHEAVARAYWPGDWAVATDVDDLGVECVIDFNYDGTVNSGDLAILLGTMGAGGSGRKLHEGELTGDGIVNSSDLADYLGRVSNGCP